MRLYKGSFGEEVDLDNPITYNYLGTDDVSKLDDIMFKEIGQALVYMDYFRPQMFPKKYNLNDRCGYEQRQRVNKLIKLFADDRHNNWKNPMWFKEQIFLFQDETENMC